MLGMTVEIFDSLFIRGMAEWPRFGDLFCSSFN